MDVSMVLAIVGTIATIGLGSWSIYIALKRRYPGCITFFEEEYIGLFDSIVSDVSDLSVLYKGSPVKQNLVLLKGILVNTGSKDITHEMIEDELSIDLPEGYRWLTGEIVSKSDKVRAEINLKNESSLLFNIGLFRCNEFIRFEALAEVPLVSDSQEIAGLKLQSAISFSHRIADTQSIDHQSLHSVGMMPIPLLLFVLLLSLGCIGYGGYIFISPPEEPAKLIYSLKTDSNKVIDVEVEPQSNGTLKLKGFDTNYTESLTVSEFYFNRRWEPKIMVSRVGKFLSPLLAIMFMLMGIFLFISYIVGYRRWKRMKELRGLLRSQVK